MQILEANNAEQLWLGALTITKGGYLVAPRQKTTHEARDTVCLELTDLSRNLIFNPYRNLNYTFALIESIGMWCGVDFVSFYKPYNKHIAEFSDDGRVLYGAYGPRFASQLKYLVNILRSDRDSRQAVITLWRPSPKKSKDIPCTVMLDFKIRDFKLNLNVYMRSNDVWLGLPYDLMNFTTIQKQVASILGIKLGVYRHITSSLHMYAGDIYKAEFALRYNGVNSAMCYNNDSPMRFDDVATDLDTIFSAEGKFRIGKDYNYMRSRVSPWFDTHVRLLKAYWARKRGDKSVKFPEPYRSIREEAREIRQKFEDSSDESRVRCHDSEAPGIPRDCSRHGDNKS